MVEKQLLELEFRREYDEQFQINEIEVFKDQRENELSIFLNTLTSFQMSACNNLLLMLTSRESFRHTEFLNNSIEELKEMRLDALQIFHQSLELLKNKNDLKSIKNCLTELKYLLENMTFQMLIVEGFGINVRGYKGMGKLLNGTYHVEKWIRVFILQIEMNHVTWGHKQINKYVQEMNEFCIKIDMIPFYSPNYRIILDPLLGIYSVTKL